MISTPTITLILFSALAAVLVSSAARTTPAATVDNTALIENWLEYLNPIERQYLTKVHFYLQDVSSGDNQTVYNVTQPAIPNSPTFFGQIHVVDHLMTAGLDYNSKRVGRAQGIHIFSDLYNIAIAMYWNFVFDDGSTLTLLGRQDVTAEEIVLSIVGGTGRYLMARGVAVRRVLRLDPESPPNRYQEYTIYVLTINRAVSVA